MIVLPTKSVSEESPALSLLHEFLSALPHARLVSRGSVGEKNEKVHPSFGIVCLACMFRCE